jgi:DNA (cytosine-5)-methyltransferase 1
MAQGMRVLDLFSGIGGFSLGLERAGMQTVAFCENDDFCQKVLAKHWPGVPIHNNIEELDGRQYRGTIQLVCGGFPCQPFSVAGKQRGAEDDRALWPEMLRVIREVEPAWVIGENVSGIINLELDNVLSDLEDSGYSCQTFVVPACAVDAKHRRDRVWIIASHTNFNSKSDGSQYEGQRSGELDVADTCRESGIAGQNFLADTIGNDGRGRSGSQPQGRDSRVEHGGGGSGQPERETDSLMADTISATGRGRGLHRDTSDQGRGASGAGATRLQPEDGETQPDHVESGSEDVADAEGQGLQGRRIRPAKQSKEPGVDDSWASSSHGGGRTWLPEPRVGRVAHGVPKRVDRLKSLGNAVVPQVVEVLGRMVMEIENEKSNP